MEREKPEAHVRESEVLNADNNTSVSLATIYNRCRCYALPDVLNEVRNQLNRYYDYSSWASIKNGCVQVEIYLGHNTGADYDGTDYYTQFDVFDLETGVRTYAATKSWFGKEDFKKIALFYKDLLNKYIMRDRKSINKKCYWFEDLEEKFRKPRREIRMIELKDVEPGVRFEKGEDWVEVINTDEPTCRVCWYYYGNGWIEDIEASELVKICKDWSRAK